MMVIILLRPSFKGSVYTVRLLFAIDYDILYRHANDAEIVRRPRVLTGGGKALKMKADLHTKIVKVASRYSQRELERILQTSQPRISDLLQGKMSKFSLEMLVTYAEQLGLEPSIKTHARTQRASAGIAFAD